MPTLKQLECFRSVAQTQNMSETARQNAVSQTSLSNMISRLEDELGVKLFTRNGKRLELNEYGVAYLKYVNLAFDTLRNGQTFLNSIKMGNYDMNTVALYSNSSVFLNRPLSEFMNEHPDIKVFQSEMNIAQMREALQTVSNSLIITSADDIEFDSLQHKVLFVDRTVLFVPKNHKLSKEKSVSLEDIKTEKFILPPPWLGFHEHCDRLFEKAGYKPDVLCECDVPMRQFFLSKGEGVSLGSAATIYSGLFDKFAVPVFLEDEHAKRELSVFWSKYHTLTETEHTFISWMRTYFEKLEVFGKA